MHGDLHSGSRKNWRFNGMGGEFCKEDHDFCKGKRGEKGGEFDVMLYLRYLDMG